MGAAIGSTDSVEFDGDALSAIDYCYAQGWAAERFLTPATTP